MTPTHPQVGAGDTAIRLAGVRCVLGRTLTLNIDTLHVTRGERIAIIGPNGAGKSSLLRLISGFLPLGAGTVEVLGQRPTGKAIRPLRCRIGQVLQGLHLVQRLSALDNVLIGALGRRSGWRTWLRWYGADDIAEAESALTRVGLSSKIDCRVDALSGGERQRVAIARMLMQQPELILADEPTAALDPQAAKEACTLLADTASGKTLVSIVHNPDLLPLLADRVIGVRHGRILFDLPVSVLNESHLGDLYAGTLTAELAGPAAPDSGKLPAQLRHVAP
ncbi:MAG: ATP-binding cassette domain-containing protein [Rhodocyclaceae bacterium]|nr:ATP-binding cassette domain-containing protein [Rhodocyclaceae bacterium]MBK6907976.1 ATP-binding cassette domain-containing protein [Rhodocyclaceae bacterium]